MVKKDLLELPFDQFQRYQTLSDFVDHVRKTPKTSLKILDVGGYPGLIRDFLPNDDIIVADVLPSDIENYIQIDGEKLPFDDGSFDLVTSCDTLEHVPAQNRRSFLSELSRVSREFLFLTAPFDDERTNLAEEILYSYVLKVLRTEFTTLKEHLDNGLPDFEETLACLKELDLNVASFPSGYLFHWLPMMVVKHHLLAYPDTAELHRKVDLLYNLDFSAKDFHEPSYRRVIAGSKKKDPRLDDFCRHKPEAQGDESSDILDLSKLQLFRMVTDLLDVNLKRDVSELVVQLKESMSDGLTETKTALAERDSQIVDLKRIIQAQNQSLDELHALVSKVRGLIPYRVYRRLFKNKNEKLP